ncbi:NPCBM/NEW2 domain-containing protein [Streptomyces wedmorensis]|uniref:NPCBM/NEW2 domain-containing protein n=1 Tax=Streptomyces wedmorensis TaxID=43759 RepID=A0ABW6J148_STRWE
MRSLLTVTGLSSREFAQLYPAYKDSTIRKYVLGANVPPWDFLRDLLTEVSRRTGVRDADQRGQELFDAYRDLLVRLGADVRGSDQNSLLLRLFDGERALHQLSLELSSIRDSEDRLRDNLARLEATAAAGGTDTSEAVQQLREQNESLARQSAELTQRRADLVADLDRTRAHLKALEAAEDRGGDHHQLAPPITTPPMPATPPVAGTTRRRRVVLAGVCALALLGAGITVGVWASKDDAPDTANDKPSASTSSPATPTPTHTPSPTPSRPPATDSASESPSPSPSTRPVFTPPSGPTTSLITMSPLENTYDPYRSGSRKVNTVTYPTTLYSDCAETTWQLDRKYSSFVARYGTTDDTISKFSFEFIVTLDGKVIADNRSNPGEDVGVVDVDVRDGYRLTLKAGQCYVPADQGQAVWIDPVLIPAS